MEPVTAQKSTEEAILLGQNPSNQALVNRQPVAVQPSPLKRLVFYITKPDETHQCNFWIGLFKNGPCSASELLEGENIDDVYEKAANKGLSDDEPILLSDTSLPISRHFYFLPASGLEKKQAEIIAEIYDVLKAMRPQKAGFYFSPELVNDSQLKELFLQTLLGACQTNTFEYYLYVGKHGMTRILNIALEAKKALEKNWQVIVFH